jgi:hypothetical protein
MIIVALGANTGSGKSFLGACVLNHFSNGSVCTVSKMIQDQYINDFPYFKNFKGMANYNCIIKDHGCDEFTKKRLKRDDGDDDPVTVYGLYSGPYTYSTAIGGTNAVPSLKQCRTFD